MPDRSPPASPVGSSSSLIKGLDVEHAVDGATYRIEANVGAPSRAALVLAWVLVPFVAVALATSLLLPIFDWSGGAFFMRGLAVGAVAAVVGLVIGGIRLFWSRQTTIVASPLGLRTDGRLLPWAGLGPVQIRQRPLRLIVENADGLYVLVNDPRPAVAEALLQRLERHRPGTSGSEDATARNAVEALVADVRSRPEPD